MMFREWIKQNVLFKTGHFVLFILWTSFHYFKNRYFWFSIADFTDLFLLVFAIYLNYPFHNKLIDTTRFNIWLINVKRQYQKCRFNGFEHIKAEKVCRIFLYWKYFQISKNILIRHINHILTCKVNNIIFKWITARYIYLLNLSKSQ